MPFLSTSVLSGRNAYRADTYLISDTLPSLKTWGSQARLGAALLTKPLVFFSLGVCFGGIGVTFRGTKPVHDTASRYGRKPKHFRSATNTPVSPAWSPPRGSSRTGGMLACSRGMSCLCKTCSLLMFYLVGADFSINDQVLATRTEH